MGEKNIFLGGRGHPAGVVVGQDHGGGVEGEGDGRDLSQVNLVGRGRALAELLHAQELELPVEAGHERKLVSRPEEIGDEKRLQAGAVGNDHVRVGAGGQVAGGDGGDELEQRHGVLSHAGDLGQVCGGGIQDARQRPEGLQKLVGQGIDVPAGAGVKQQQLQHPWFGKMR